jgi:hypothetical protein
MPLLRRESASHWHASVLLLGSLLACLIPASASGFILSSTDPDPWLSTASGPRIGNGAPAIITWSIVPDGTPVFNESQSATAPSNLIAFMNQNFGGNPGQTDLTLQPWFHFIDDAFERWDELSGVNYVYEPHDDGVVHPSGAGFLGVRGDIRLGGRSVDGASGTLAYTWLPPFGSDMTLDTGDAAFFMLATNDHVRLRNTWAHEIGHSFGILHVSSTGSNLLMETLIDTSFDGPQLDEVRGVQFFFGDPNEESHGGLGNGAAPRATSLGTIASGASAVIGSAANVPGQAIAPTAVDFVSIANNADVDFYSFSVTERSFLSATLIPRGGVFNQPGTFDANARNDLALTVFAPNGVTILGTANASPAGVAESLPNLKLASAGAYFVRIAGADDTIQLYELSLAVTAIAPADFNEDGEVDDADLAVWRTHVGAVGSATHEQGDADGDLDVDFTDFLTWQRQLGSSTTIPLAAAVPEPSGWILLAWPLATALRRARMPRFSSTAPTRAL